MNLSQIDPSLVYDGSITEADIAFYDIKKLPVDFYGLYDPLGEAPYKRMPVDAAELVSDRVAALNLNTAGGRIRFSTDSAYVAISVTVPKATNAIMTAVNVRGFDLYEDFPTTGQSKFRGVYKPGGKNPEGYQGIIKFTEKKMRYFTLNFPCYAQVHEVLLGLQKDSVIGEGMKYVNSKPIVYYGSSITQGAAACRPGNTYQNMISRRFNFDYHNYGFSGSGKAEPAMVEYLAGLDMCCFVCDYDHNTPNAEYLHKTHFPMYEQIRAAHPDIPYIMISRPDFDADYNQSILRRDAIIDSFRRAYGAGDKLVYYIDGAGIFAGEYEYCCTVDGTHPNDLGFMLMSEAIIAVIKRSMTDGAKYE